MSVGVRMPLGGCDDAAGTGAGAPACSREPSFETRVLPTGAAGPATPTISDIEAFASSQSVVKGKGRRIASSSAKRMAEAVRDETPVVLRGQ